MHSCPFQQCQALYHELSLLKPQNFHTRTHQGKTGHWPEQEASEQLFNQRHASFVLGSKDHELGNTAAALSRAAWALAWILPGTASAHSAYLCLENMSCPLLNLAVAACNSGQAP